VTVKDFILILYKKYIYILVCKKEEYIYFLLAREHKRSATCGNPAAIVAAVLVSSSWIRHSFISASGRSPGRDDVDR
jgi:hypothetical protein